MKFNSFLTQQMYSLIFNFSNKLKKKLFEE